MTPKWLYVFNHYLMLVSVGLLLIVIAIGLVLWPFMKLASYEFICWWCGFLGWALPILFALFCISSGVVVSDFSRHRITKKDEEKKD